MQRTLQPSFAREASRVAVRRAPSYQNNLYELLAETLREFNLPVRGKTVLLKPNFVGLDSTGSINTHPAVVAAAREAFLRLGADRVLVGDGPALERDTQAILESMRLGEYLGRAKDVFVDLNLDDVQRTTLKARASKLRELYLPRTVLGADLVVSVAKMKTHHWAGVTLSMKNMFGIVPGACYGWPKNILHQAGIGRSLLDINATVGPDFAIVDGIVGMEGNGPIQGVPKPCGVLVVGDDPVAVDSTCARIMGLVPEKLQDVRRAALLLGNMDASRIHQIGESIESVRTRFHVLDAFLGILAAD